MACSRKFWVTGFASQSSGIILNQSLSAFETLGEATSLSHPLFFYDSPFLIVIDRNDCVDEALAANFFSKSGQSSKSPHFVGTEWKADFLIIEQPA